MKVFILLVLFLALTNCKNQESSKVEFISVSGRAMDYNGTDSLIMAIYVHLYAQIGQDGNCSVINRANEIVNFFVDKDLYNRVMTKLETIKTDTLLTHNCKDCIYDGPTHQLIYHKDKNQAVIISYTNLKGTDKDFLELYNEIDSINQTVKANIDSINRAYLISHRDSMINQIKTKILKTEKPFGRDSIMIIL